MNIDLALFEKKLEVQKPGLTPLHLQTMTIFGSPGSGKSGIGAGIPGHIYFDLEASAVEYEINAVPNEYKTWEGFKAFVESIALTKSSLDGRTIVIDTVGDLWEMCVASELKRRKLSDMPDDFARTLNSIRKEFKRVLHLLLNLRMEGRMGVVFIAHEESEEIKTPYTTTTVFRPKVADKDIKGWIAEKPQLVLRTSREDLNPLTKKPFSDRKTHWIVRTSPISANDVVKDRTRRLPEFTGATWDHLNAAYNKTTTMSESGE